MRTDSGMRMSALGEQNEIAQLARLLHTLYARHSQPRVLNTQPALPLERKAGNKMNKNYSSTMADANSVAFQPPCC